MSNKKPTINFIAILDTEVSRYIFASNTHGRLAPCLIQQDNATPFCKKRPTIEQANFIQPTSFAHDSAEGCHLRPADA
ncbi:hypothetical protein [Aeromonas dhakensis]|uniref:hypothetical protein n=1 Tax=Aeromonas dhakensis TaxID=196024 RepID=UPI0030DC0B92